MDTQADLPSSQPTAVQPRPLPSKPVDLDPRDPDYWFKKLNPHLVGLKPPDYVEPIEDPLAEEDPEDALEEEDGSNGHPSLSALDHRTARIHNPTPGPSPDPAGGPLQGARRVAEANRAPRCIHVKAGGVRCGSPALRGFDYCYFHKRLHSGPRLIAAAISKIEDAHGLQSAIMDVLIGIIDSRIDSKTASLLLYGLQTAATNLKRIPNLDPEQIVTEEPLPGSCALPAPAR